jgi:hypothetical protein
MSQKCKDSANFKGEMTMITRASKLKKVPDAPLDLEDNNPTLVTPVKKMPVLYYVISASDGRMPHFAKSDEEKDEYIEDLDGSYTVDKFESLDEAITHYSNQIQAFSLALASKAPAVSPRAKTAGHKIKQPKPCAEPVISVPVKTVASLEEKPPAVDSASDRSFKKPSETKEKCLEMLQKSIWLLQRVRKLLIPSSCLCSSLLTRKILSLVLIFRMPRVKSCGSSNQPSFLLLLNLLLISFLD